MPSFPAFPASGGQVTVVHLIQAGNRDLHYVSGPRLPHVARSSETIRVLVSLSVNHLQLVRFAPPRVASAATAVPFSSPGLSLRRGKTERPYRTDQVRLFIPSYPRNHAPPRSGSTQVPSRCCHNDRHCRCEQDSRASPMRSTTVAPLSDDRSP